jgi:hypothetical protein
MSFLGTIGGIAKGAAKNEESEDTSLLMAPINYLKDLYTQGKALVHPLTGEAQAIADKSATIDQYKNGTQPVSQSPLGVIAPAAPAANPGAVTNPAAHYGDRPGEQRLQWALKPLPSYAKGTPYVPEDQIAQIHEGEKIVPADQNPDNPEVAEVQTPQLPAIEVAPHTLSGTTNMSGKPSQPSPLGSIDGDPVKEADPSQIKKVDPAFPKTVAPPELMQALQADKMEAAKSGNLVGLGKAMISEKLANMPTYGGPNADGSEAPKPGEKIDDDTAKKDTQEQYKNRLKDYDERIRAAEDLNTPQGHILAGDLKQAKVDFMKQNPWGTNGNHPGLGGKILHGLSEIGQIAGSAIAPQVVAQIPGTQLNLAEKRGEGEAETAAGEDAKLKEAQAAHQNASAKAVSDQNKLYGQLLVHGYTLGQDTAGNPVLNQVPGFRDDPKNIQQPLAAAVQQAVAEGRNPMEDPNIQHMIQVAQASHPAQPSQEQNKRDFQDVVKKVAGSQLSTGPKDLEKSLDTAKANGTISADEYNAAKAYMAANSNPATSLNVTVAGAEEKQKLHDKNKLYSYVDEDNKTQWATGGKLPAGVEATEIKNPEQSEAILRSGNVVQQSLNNLHEDIEKHPEVFDNPTARNILATATEEINRASAGLLIAGTGGTIPLPSGLGHMIDTALQNKALDKNTSDAVKKYIADYKAMKDKALVMQMELQGGKIGRAGAQGFLSITAQIPDGSTPDSKTAKNQMINLQRSQDELTADYPETYKGFKKEKAYGTAPLPGSSGKDMTGTGVREGMVVYGPGGSQLKLTNGKWVDQKTGQEYQPKKGQ